MKANRTLMDALVDIANGIVDAFNAPISDELEKTLSGDGVEDELSGAN